MTKTKTRAIVVLIVCFALACLAAFLPYAFKADAYELTMNLFSSRNMRMEENALLSEKSDYQDSRKGLRASGKKGAYLSIDGTLAGAFDTEFIPESNLSAMTFTFANAETGESFDLVVSFGAVNISAYVECAGEKVGLYYFGTKGLNETTGIYNSVGNYTQYVNQFKAVTASFDPATMLVKIGDYAVWCLKNEVSDGRRVSFTLDSFERYTVRATFSNATGNASAIFYALNGQSLDNTLLIPSAAPRIFANFAYKGVAGEKYSLPKANVYDVIDGEISADEASVSVAKGNEAIAVENGAFLPDGAGEYTVSYTVKNKAGFSAVQKYALTVNEGYGGEMTFSDSLPSGELGRHTLAYFPAVKYENANIFSLAEIPVRAEIFLDGVSVEKISDAGEGFTYVLDAAGSYEIVYAPVHKYYAKDTYTAEIEVEENGAGYTLSSAWKSAYTTSDTAELPSMIIHTPEGDKPAASTVRFPDGAQYSNTRFALSQAGVYTVTYTAGEYAIVLTFEALNDPSALFSATGNVEMHEGEVSFNSNIGGLVMETEIGSEITYKNVINLNEYAYNTDKESSLLFEIMCDPYKTFYADLVSMDFVLTDIYDPENYVTITLTQLWENANTQWACLRAGYGNQATKGLEGDADMQNNKVNGNLHVNQAGFLFNGSMSATPCSSFNKALITTQVWFDYAERAIYAQFDTIGYTQSFTSRRALVVDLDHSDYFDTPWEGFTTGECTLTIKPNSYTGTNARFVVVGVDRQDFSNGAFQDKTAPKITVNTAADDGSTSIPYGVVGYEYPIFDAVAVDDMDGVVNVEKKVYYLYYDSAFDISVKNGRFLPEEAGKYRIDYTARDLSGNETTYSVIVEVREENYYEDYPLRAVLEEDYATAVRAGESVAVAKVKEVKGGAGRAQYAVTVKDGEGGDVALTNGKFRPTEAGTYTVTYTLSDFLGVRKAQTYTVEAAAHDGVVFLTEKLRLPSAILSGVRYGVPSLQAIDYASGKAVEKTATLSLQDQSGNEIAIRDGGFVVTDRSIETVTFTYACPDTGATKAYTLPVRKTTDADGRFDFTAYFYGENVTATQSAESVKLETDAAGAKAEYLKAVLVNNLDFSVYVNTGTAGSLNAFDVVFRDAENDDVSVRFTVRRSGDGATVSLNGGKETTITGSFTGSSGYPIGFVYQKSDASFNDKAGNPIGFLKTCENGEPFEGFSSGKVAISVEFAEIEGVAALDVLNVNKQLFLQNNRADTVRADIFYEQTLGGNYSVGDVIEIPAFTAVDVLANTDKFVTVRSSDGAYATDEKGNVLNGFPYYEGMRFTIEETGDYYVQLIAKDYLLTGDGIVYVNTAIEYLPSLSANDRTDPTIALNGSVPKSAKVGETVKLPFVTVDDNGGKDDLTVYVFCIGPDSKTTLVKEDFGEYSFKPEEKGTYTIKYVVTDAYFNYAEIEAKIVVK